LNLLETIGAFVIALSVLIFLVNVFVSRRRGRPSGDDPWDGRTLEWSIPSPPPAYNFKEVPLVTHRDEFWHRKYTEDDQGVLVKLPSGGAIDLEDEPTAEGHGIHMPSPSYWPLVFAFSLPLLGWGFVYKNWWLVGVGVLIALFGLSAFALEPPTAPDDEHGEHSDGGHH
ncbi:MAG: cytochrome ubiquinol oxidase subunit I, partial [Acidimicrobiia bacterium]